ncbi:hypothetical protein BaRGS_00014038, partial [Batillaria attramentaria]
MVWWRVAGSHMASAINSPFSGWTLPGTATLRTSEQTMKPVSHQHSANIRTHGPPVNRPPEDHGMEVSGMIEWSKGGEHALLLLQAKFTITTIPWIYWPSNARNLMPASVMSSPSRHYHLRQKAIDANYK